MLGFYIPDGHVSLQKQVSDRTSEMEETSFSEAP